MMTIKLFHNIIIILNLQNKTIAFDIAIPILILSGCEKLVFVEERLGLIS